jgi:glutaredoxin
MRWLCPVLLLMMVPGPTAQAASKEDPLAAARQLLEAGDFEKVLDAVNAAKGAPAADAAAVLAGAGELAADKQDRGMAALYCEMSLARAPGDKRALTLCLKVAVADERWEDAGIWGDALGKQMPKDPEVALLRGKAALGDMAWPRALQILKPHAKGPLAAKVKPLIDEAERRIAEERESDKQQREVEGRLAKAILEARALEHNAPPKGGARSSDVVIYTTAWCPVCKQAKQWLTHKGVNYTEKDVETDPDATEELAAKCAQAHVRPSGVPVLDARGKLIVGFSAGAYSAALR